MTEKKTQERKAVDKVIAYYLEAKHLDKPLVLWSKSKIAGEELYAFMITEEQFDRLRKMLEEEAEEGRVPEKKNTNDPGWVVWE